MTRLPPLRRRVLSWYRKHKRDLPWRRTRDPYAIWVSEIMLQQTRVETVVPFYRRFLRRFPGVNSLAKARESQVLAAWSGLGYYRRARHLHAAARIVVRRHGARIPEDRASLLALPGIGEYTAAAIQSIAFGRAAAAVDGNVIRVLARIGGYTGRRDSARLRRAVTATAESLARGPDPGDWTQALMELGATTCVPRDPLCDRCPAARDCVAKRRGRPDRFPEAQRAVLPREEHRVVLVARSGRRVLLIPDDADARATWTLPYARLGASSSSRAARGLVSRLVGSAGPQPDPMGSFRHRTFSHSLTYEIWSVDLQGNAASSPRLPGNARSSAPGGPLWATSREVGRLPVRSHTLKALRTLDR